MIPAENKNLLIKMAIILGLDYVRWTQLVPMVFGWAFVIIMVFALFLISFQGEIDSMLERAEPHVERILGPAPDQADNNKTNQGDDSSIQITEDDIIPWIYRIWGALALVMWVFSMVRRKLWGPPKRRRLRKKIGITGICVLCAAGFIFLFTTILGGFTNTTGEFIFALSFGALVLFIVSFWGIGISHYIGKIQDWVETLEFGSEESTAIN